MTEKIKDANVIIDGLKINVKQMQNWIRGDVIVVDTCFMYFLPSSLIRYQEINTGASNKKR